MRHAIDILLKMKEEAYEDYMSNQAAYKNHCLEKVSLEKELATLQHELKDLEIACTFLPERLKQVQENLNRSIEKEQKAIQSTQTELSELKDWIERCERGIKESFDIHQEVAEALQLLAPNTHALRLFNIDDSEQPSKTKNCSELRPDQIKLIQDMISRNQTGMAICSCDIERVLQREPLTKAEGSE